MPTFRIKRAGKRFHVSVAFIAELSVWTAFVLYQMHKHGIDDLELLASKLEAEMRIK